jgi:hypothetical protein
VLFKNDKDQGRYAIPQLKGFGSLQQFFEMKRDGCPITLALVCLWESPPVTETIAEWLDKDFHSNVLMVIHSTRNPSPGKALVICEPNIVDKDDDDEEPMKIPNVRMQKMIKKVRGKMAKKSVVFINNERPETNTSGICLTLALEWMVQLIAGKDALAIERDESSRVTCIEGFQYISPP